MRPPCRGFIPKLSEWQTNLKKTNSDFELVFVRSDRDEAAFKKYFGEVPFLARSLMSTATGRMPSVRSSR